MTEQATSKTIELRLIPAPANPLDEVQAEEWLLGFLSSCQAVIQFGLEVEDPKAREAIEMLSVDVINATEAAVPIVAGCRVPNRFTQEAWSDEIAEELALIVATQTRQSNGPFQEVYDAFARRLADNVRAAHPGSALSDGTRRLIAGAWYGEQRRDARDAMLRSEGAELEIGHEDAMEYESNVLPAPQPTRLGELGAVLWVAEEALYLVQHEDELEPRLRQEVLYDTWTRVGAVRQAMLTGRWGLFSAPLAPSDDLSNILAAADDCEACSLSRALVEEPRPPMVPVDVPEDESEREDATLSSLRAEFGDEVVDRLARLNPDKLTDALDELNGSRLPAE